MLYLYEKLCSWAIFRLLTPKSSVQFMGTLWPKNWKNTDFLLVTVSFLLIEKSEIPQLKALTSSSISSSYSNELWAIQEDVMTKATKIWWFLTTYFVLSHWPFLFKVVTLWNYKLIKVYWLSRSRWSLNRNLLTVACNCSPLVLLFSFFPQT